MITAVRDGHDRAAPRTSAGGARRALLPLAVGIAGLSAAGAVQLVFDPFRTHVPLCLLHQLTGLDCPGCGAIRAVHSLLAGDLLMALRSNLLITLAIPSTAIGLGVWAVRRARGLRTQLLPSRTSLLVLAGLALLFTVLRNLPAFWFLAPISYVGG